jgi:hypothetical protein
MGRTAHGNTNHALVNSRSNPVVVFAVHDNFSDLESSKVGQSKLDELAGFVQFVKLLESLLERHASVGGVQVEDIDAVSAELLERFVKLLFDHLGCVSTGSVRVPLGGTGQTTLLPFGLAGESLLLATDIDSGGVNFVVSGALEAVEDLVVVVDVGDFGTFGHIGTERESLALDAFLKDDWILFPQHTQRSWSRG